MTSLLYVCGLGLIFLAAAYWALCESGVLLDVQITELLIGVGALLVASGILVLWHKIRN